MTTLNKYTTPIVGFCAHSGTGKTTLLKQLIPLLTAQGVRIGVVKHAHHSFDTDQPGKDSYELRKAGAQQTLVSSSQRNVLITEISQGEAEPTLDELIGRLDDGSLDLILVEGFKREPFPKIELFRKTTDEPPAYMYPDDPHIIALVTDAPPADETTLPILDLNDTEALADFVMSRVVQSKQE